MTRKHTVGVLAGVTGAALTGAAVGGLTRWSKLARERRDGNMAPADRPEPAQLGLLPPGTPYSVTADDGLRLAAEVIEPPAGRAKLTVVFVHGFALDRRCWHFQRQVFAERPGSRTRLVFYDQRGHGASERPARDSCTIAQLASDLDCILRTLVADGPIVLVGHSMGGMAIIALAEQDPTLFAERIAGVALLCTSAGEVAASGLPATFLSRRNVLTRAVGALAGWQPGLVERWRTLLGDLIWGVTRAYAYGDRKIDTWLVDFVHAMISANAVDALVDFVDTLNTHNRLAALPALKRTEVLILAGEADRIIPIRHSEVIAGELPDATLARLPGVGHMAMLERPDDVNEALSELIENATSGGWLVSRLWRRA